MRKFFKNLHLWLSVPFGIFITLICFSGAMLVFETEITEKIKKDVYFVEPSAEGAKEISELMESVEATLPDSVSIQNVTISNDPKRAYQVGLSEARQSVYVNQYTGEVTGKSERLPFFATMFKLHRWLLGSATNAEGNPSVGKLIVGCSTMALVIILITGVILCCIGGRSFLKCFKISFTKGWKRFWYDLHVAGGLYATIFLLALALTGLTWSFSWYRSGFYSLFGVEASAGGHGGPGGHGDKRGGGRPDGKGGRGEGHGNWHSRGENGGEGRGGHGDGGWHGHGDGASAEGNGEGWHGHDGGEGGWHDGGFGGGFWHSPYSRWQEIYEKLAAENEGFRQISVGNETASVVPAGRKSLRAADNYEFSRRSGEITSSKPYSEQDKSTKVRAGVYMTHVGTWGGMLTRIVTFIAALLGATLPLTGYYLWIKRIVRKKK
jgi:uncharacterized iron-regulated membrane protein